MHQLAASVWLGRLALLGLCAAYLQGGINKLLDFPGPVAEATHFGLPWPVAVAALTIVIELGGSAMVLAGRGRAIGSGLLGAFTLAASFIANTFWLLPAGQERFMAANAFFEHLGLVCAFLVVARLALRGERP